MTVALTFFTNSLPISACFCRPSSRPQNLRFRRFRFRPTQASSSSSSPTTQQLPKPSCSSVSHHHRKTGVVVIGAGLAGLAAATHLYSQKIPFLLLEASDAVGGRVRTDVVDGFLLDRGFQIFITAYPEAQKLLDYQALSLRKFYSGARIYFDGQFHTVADPLRHPFDSLKSLANPVGSFLDKLLIALTRIRLMNKTDEEILAPATAEETTTIDMLRQVGFSDSIIGRFFRPFFGGIFFDNDLQTTSKLFDFIFKCLALGDNTLPAEGIGAIPDQLAAKLPPDSILLNSRVVSIDFDEPLPSSSSSSSSSSSPKSSSPPLVRLENGGLFESELGVIVAVEQPEIEKLLAGRGMNTNDVGQRKPARSTVCLYFSADRDVIPVQDPVLFLNGSGKGIVNNMSFATNVTPSYGPPGKALASVSLVGLFDDMSDEHITAEAVRELSGWFGGSTVGSWRHLRTYRIRFAQPNQCPPTHLTKNPRVGPGVYMCGDHVTSATFDGALVSGRKAVEALLRDGAFVRF